ncbi:NF-kappa-B inhibitor zeta [Discoglossus pictus]
MIVEMPIEDTLEMLDQELMMGSPMDFGYFYGGYPSSEASSSPTHSTSSSGPCSPSSDSEQGGILSQSWPGTKRAGRYIGIGRQNKGTFQGVRVKNSVRELLMLLRSKPNKSADEVENLQRGMTCEQSTELKTLLAGKKRTHDFSLEGPVEKKQCANQIPIFLTPPSTPKSSDNMDDMQRKEIRVESNLDMLQILMKNESNPVSLNTVQVNWMTNMPESDNSQEHHYQDVPVANTFSPQSSLAFSSCSSPPNGDLFPFPSQQTPDVSPRSNTEYNNFADQLPNYQSSVFSSQEFPSCFVPLPDSGTSTNMMPAAESNIQAQNFSPNYNFRDHNMMQASPNMSPPLHNSSTLQIGKSFFQWQIDQEENKIMNMSQEQLVSKDADGDTYLHIAVAQGRRALSYVLARRMAAMNRLDIKERNNQSALQVAVAANQHLIVQDLISLGAQVSTTDYWGRTPLHVCAVKGYSQVLQAIQKEATLNNQYVDVEATNYEGLTALHCAVMAHNIVLQQLQKNQQLRSPEREELMLRSKAMVETVRTLLQMGASVDAKDRKSGRTALHLASEEANLELLRLFLDLPTCLSFVNVKAFNGNTALHVAASLQYRISQLDAVRLLMRRGADPSARNLENEQPVHLVPDGPLGEQIRRILKGKTIQQRTSPY